MVLCLQTLCITQDCNEGCSPCYVPTTTTTAHVSILEQALAAMAILISILNSWAAVVKCYRHIMGEIVIADIEGSAGGLTNIALS